MARAKKEDLKGKAPVESVEDNEPATVQVHVEAFVRHRDSVVTGLAAIQDAINTLSAAYIKHCGSILGEHGLHVDISGALSGLNSNPLLSGSEPVARATAPAEGSPVAENGEKKKKKRIHDPNAPKRPLTPYFLYMQTARPIISHDLGSEVPKNAVSTEGLRRWNAMSAADRELWNNAYKDNLKLYQARVHSYKNGNPDAKQMTDDEAAQYSETHNVGVLEPTADGQLTAEALLDAPADDDEELLPPPVTSPTPKGNKRKPAAAAPTPKAATGPIVPPSSAKPVESAKRKRAGKKGEESAEKENDVTATQGETPKPKGRAKKAKTAA